MLIVYDSLTGNVKRFINKLGVETIKITPNLLVNRPFILVTYTIGFGEIPKTTEDFLSENHPNIIGVAVSGNKNWGERFAKAADTISIKYNVPIVHKFELSGSPKDVDIFIKRATKLVEEYQRGKIQGE